MARSAPSYDDLLRENTALRVKLADCETRIERLECAAASAEAVFYDFDLRPGGQFILQGIERLIGLAPGEIDFTREWWISRLHPEDAPVYLAGLERQFNERGVMKAVFRVLHASGEWLHVESSGESILDEYSQAVHLIGVIVNISQRTAAEAALRESEGRYRNLADTMPLMIFTATTDGLVEYINRPGLVYVGLRLDEAIGLGWLAKIHPEDRPMSKNRWLECMQTGMPYECEIRLLRADGQYRWQLARAVPIADEDGNILRWIGTSTDIHDRRQAELALQESRMQAERQAEELDRLYQTSPAGLAFLDRDLRFVRINRTLADINGIPVDAHIGRSVREMLPSELAERLEPIIRYVVEEGRPAMNVEIGESPLASDGKVRSWLANYYPMKSREGAVVGVNAVVQDITERKRTEESLKKSHAFIRQIIDTDPNFVFAKDRQGRFTLVNQALADCYGTTVEELLGKTDADFNPHHEEVAHFQEKNRDVFDSLKDLFIREETITDASGSIHWLQTVRRPLFDEHCRATQVLGVATDITQRKLADDALRESEERFRTLADNISQFAWMADAAGSRFWYNQRWYEYTGATFEEMRGWGWENVHHPEHVDRVRETWRKARDSGKSWEGTFPMRGRDGRYRWFLCHATPIRDDQGRIGRWFGTNTDVTELRQAQEELRQSEERLRLALAGGEMGAWDVDLVNDTACWDSKELALLGLREGSGVCPSPMKFYRCIHPEDKAVVRQSVDRAIDETGSLEHEFRVILSDGQMRWLAAKGRVLRDEEGKPVRMIGVNFDVTERKLAEARFRSFAQELEVRVAERTGELVHLHERLRALTMDLNLTEQRERKRLATDLHDYLAQLLALVRMKLGQIRHLALPPPQGEILREAEVVVNEALTYTRTLVTQLSPPVLHEFGLPAALRWLAEQMVRQELSVEIRQFVPDHIPLPEDQAVLLFQSVRELLINVRKHAETHQAVLTIAKHDEALRITVRDEGAGVDLVLASAGTEQPSSTSSKFGLFSIRERMLAIGGQFEVASAPGQGMTAQLILPLMNLEGMGLTSAAPCEKLISQQSARPMHAASHPASKTPQDTPCIRVLLVDDHPLVREGVRGLLQDHDDIAIVGEAWDGEEAIAFVDKLRPDCVLMDVNMPRIDGIEATRRIKAAFRHTVIVGISVNTSKELEAAMRRAGADEFLSKAAPAEVMYRTIVDTTVKSRRATANLIS